MTFRLQVLTSQEELARITPAWDALAATADLPTNSAEWHLTAAQCVHPQPDRLHVISLWASETLVGLAPLMLTRGPSGLRYEIIGAHVLFEPTAVISHDRPAAEQLASAVAALKRPVMLARMPATSDFNVAFNRSARQGGVVLPPDPSGSQWIDLSEGWESYYENLSSRLKDTVRRHWRQLAKVGQIEFECVSPASQDAEEVLQEAFEVELHSWKARTGSAVLLCENLRRFFLAYGEQIAQHGELRVAFLRLDGKPVAMQVANVSHEAYWLLKIGYDEQYSKYHTGWLLQMESIRWAAEQGLQRYEFLGSEEGWIRNWADKVHCYATMLFYPFSMPGLHGLLRDGFHRVQNKLAPEPRAMRTS